MHEPDLLILAPAHELSPTFTPWQIAGAGYGFRCATDTAFNVWVETFLDEGVWFPFDADGRLPAALPAELAPFKCIVIDPQRRDEFATGTAAETLRQFEREGGFVFYPPAGKGDANHVHAYCLRVIATAGLAQRNPAMAARQHAVEDERLLNHWVRTLPEQAAVLGDADAGWAWGDPTAYHIYWPAEAAAEVLEEPALMEPVWDLVRAGLDRKRWPGRLSCGKRFALKWYERSRDPAVLARVLEEADKPGDHYRHWMVDGLRVNMELQAPADCDPADPPPRVRANAWMWPEVTGNMADGHGFISKVSGNPSYAELAVRQMLAAHRWNFAPDISLWYHIGRPSGPERLSAPWGRGNGWMLYGLRGLLEDLPDAHPDRPALVRMLADELEGLLRQQGRSGLWRNVLDAGPADSREETSCTWMFINVYARAYWKGWLRDPRIPEMCERAWKGLKTRLWRGLPVGHCEGTPYMFGRQGYLSRPQGKFMGTATLLALLELRRMRASC